MGGKSDSPDYAQAARLQGEANKEVVRDQTFANRPTQYTPWGFTAWNPYRTTDPASGEAVTRWEQVEGLTPELQDILNKQIAIQGGRSDVAGMLTERMGGEFGDPLNWDGLSPMGHVPQAQFTVPEGDIGDPYGTRQRAEDAVYNQAMSRVQPNFDSKRKALEIKMRNQGVGPQDEAWQSQMASLDRQENDATNQAMWSASGAGREESGQMYGQLADRNRTTYDQSYRANQSNFNQAMAASKYANAIRQQQITEAMQKRGFSLNEINALLKGQQVQTPQMPSFMGASQAQPAPIYQATVDQGNFDQASNQMMMEAITGLAGGAMML